MEKKRKSIKKIIMFWFILTAAIVLIASIALRLSMRAPEGNNTINLTGRVNKDVPIVTENEPISEEPPKKNIYTFLVAGKDKVSDNTDTIMLVRLDIGNKNIRILNIPRDTMIDTDRKSKKINSSYVIGGIEQFEKDVASLTGFYVNRYVLFDIAGVERIIDEIGGVYIDIPRNMNYEDPTQDLYIHLKKGYQHLDGKQAVNLARFRNYPEGDIDRIAMQQKLLIELAKQALKPENVLKIPELVAIVKDNVQTDIDMSEMLWLANEAKNIPLSSIETDIVPGVASTVDNLSYWLPYENALLDLINSRYNPLDSPITVNDISIVEFSANREG
ncbi:MAG: LCP family protein [Clostridiaceae bacterium]|jgi:LCP family protein required for cell wall assembly|nr:LCP family protein [Clostridiaceae bacterium]